MADLIVSTAVDDLMQAADAAAARTVLGAAPLASPTFTGTPAAPTAAGGTSTTQLATTAFVAAAVAGVTPGYIAVANFAALPAAASHSGETYFASAAQGVIWVNRKPAGLYTSNGSAWIYDADQTDAYLAGLTPSAGQIPVGDGTNFVTKTVSGDATLASTGAVTIAANAVTNAKAAQMAANTVKVNATSSTADATDLAFAASTIFARLAAGNIVAATVAQIKSLLAYAFSDLTGSVAAGQMPALTGPVSTSAGAVATTLKCLVQVAASDTTTAITAGTGKVTFRMPFAMTVTEVRASVSTAPTGSTIIIDINEAGTTILSTKLSIDATEKTSTTAATAPVISDASLADDAEMTIDFDQVGATIAGVGVVVALIGTRTS